MKRARNESLVRVLTLMQRLRGGRCTLADLASEFAVTQRTVRRDLEALSVAGVPVRYSSGDMNDGSAATWWVVSE